MVEGLWGQDKDERIGFTIILSVKVSNILLRHSYSILKPGTYAVDIWHAGGESA